MNTVTAGTDIWTPERILSLSIDEARDFWYSLPAPEFKEMNGEYTGLLPKDGAWAPYQTEEGRKGQQQVMLSEAGPHGYWLGKAFKPIGATYGEGYNHWRKPGNKVVRFMRFGTEMGTSIFDGNPSLIMHYSHFDPYGRGILVDEIRKVSDGIYLGGGSGLLKPNADGRRSPLSPFLLIGPIGEWIGVDDPKAELKK